MELELEPLDVTHARRLRELHQEPEVLRWWGPMEPFFPFDEPESQRFAIVVDSEIAGLIQWGDDSYEEIRHAYVDIFLGEDFAGRGIGTQAMQRMVELLVDEHGYHRIAIDPAPENIRAVRCYEKVGFTHVGRLHRAYFEPWSKQWRDELRMELVVEPKA